MTLTEDSAIAAAASTCDSTMHCLKDGVGGGRMTQDEALDEFGALAKYL